MLRDNDEKRRVEFLESSPNKPFRYKIGESVEVLRNRGETLLELEQEYQIDGNVDVICNTQKLEKVNVRKEFKVARTAGHFGMFCSCGIVCAADIFFLDESLSQV